MKWNDLARGQPTLAALAHDKLVKPGVLLVGTVRKDGSARVSGVEPLVLDGELYLSMMQRSTKALDLYRDPRITIHSIVTGPEAAGEVKLRGTVRLVEDREIHERYATAMAATAGWQPVVGHFALFAIELDSLTYVGYDEATGAQHVAQWPSNEEYLRETISPTKLGPKRSVRRLTSA
ncbi:pyridoxamine 5'-phosphate oxidase family protein [Tenggerimyces flavus]|uniref:Pyridoxamine 5'-phosphate oxidase family protein n=1 Tax=Tenggerimyces flavus TaxID=1708749 RepID=A0ABV7YD52_9ACTN|nr:pyridoxamine 5'-phosphate oxidase family protein [Tenggerimyces flavus]MBM7783372.1 hypothetical protein [Tenggerimyces flavus]